jgi:Inner membrane component of T3SS, cytoplasmic domain
MGFQLVISEGKDAGREFDFDQASIVIGRTAECDVILYEAGVSRKHAKIFSDHGAFFIEDLGSSNGTRVNGSTIQEARPLRQGDLISMGPVVFNFKALELESDPQTQEHQVDDAGHAALNQGQMTRILSLAELEKSRNRAVALVPDGATPDDLAQLGQRGTSALPVLAPSSQDDLPHSLEVQVSNWSDSDLSRRPSAEHSAAERARMRRGSVSARAKLWWSDASLPKRALASVVVRGMVGGLVGGLTYLAWPEETKVKPKEPEVLTQDPIEYSFGVGPDVTFVRDDSKTFDFEVRSPVQVMVVLHYQAKDIGSKDEVSLTINGVELGWVPPDTLDHERALEVIIPAALVKRGEINTVTFDNVKNPPEHDAWKIWHLFVEVAVLPSGDKVTLYSAAEEKYRRGLTEWDQRDIGASNRWDAYKNFREAWLTLEVLPTAERPATSQLARDKMAVARMALDEKCAELLLKARSAFNFGKYDQARYELDHVRDFFPSTAHSCQARANHEREDMDL